MSSTQARRPRRAIATVDVSSNNLAGEPDEHLVGLPAQDQPSALRCIADQTAHEAVATSDNLAYTEPPGHSNTPETLAKITTRHYGTGLGGTGLGPTTHPGDRHGGTVTLQSLARAPRRYRQRPVQLAPVKPPGPDLPMPPLDDEPHGSAQTGWMPAPNGRTLAVAESETAKATQATGPSTRRVARRSAERHLGPYSAASMAPWNSPLRSARSCTTR